MPAYSSAWAESNSREQLLDAGSRHFCFVQRQDVQVGDVLIFRLRPQAAAKRMGILSGNKRFIHAYDGACVVEGALSKFWESRIASVFRFPSIVNEGSE
jgi:NlpC/P60 family putative phage cell wall peptidase